MRGGLVRVGGPGVIVGRALLRLRVAVGVRVQVRVVGGGRGRIRVRWVGVRVRVGVGVLGGWLRGVGFVGWGLLG